MKRIWIILLTASLLVLAGCGGKEPVAFSGSKESQPPGMETSADSASPVENTALQQESTENILVAQKVILQEPRQQIRPDHLLQIQLVLQLPTQLVSRAAARLVTHLLIVAHIQRVVIILRQIAKAQTGLQVPLLLQVVTMGRTHQLPQLLVRAFLMPLPRGLLTP